MGFALLVDRTLLGAYVEAARQGPRALRKRAVLGRSLRTAHSNAGVELAALRVAPRIPDLTGLTEGN